MRAAGHLSVSGLALRLGISRKHMSNDLWCVKVPLGEDLADRLAAELKLAPEHLRILRHDGIVPRERSTRSPSPFTITTSRRPDRADRRTGSNPDCRWYWIPAPFSICRPTCIRDPRALGALRDAAVGTGGLCAVDRGVGDRAEGLGRPTAAGCLPAAPRAGRMVRRMFCRLARRQRAAACVRAGATAPMSCREPFHRDPADRIIVAEARALRRPMLSPRPQDHCLRRRWARRRQLPTEPPT